MVVCQKIPGYAEDYYKELQSRELPEGAHKVREGHEELDVLVEPISEEKVVDLLRTKYKGAEGSDG